MKSTTVMTIPCIHGNRKAWQDVCTAVIAVDCCEKLGNGWVLSCINAHTGDDDTFLMKNVSQDSCSVPEK